MGSPRVEEGAGASTAAAVTIPHLDDGTGDRTYHPTAFAELDHDYSFGIGFAEVLLPAGVDYDVTGDLTAGDLDILGASEDGFNNELTAQSDSGAPTTVIIELEVDIGYGRVTQG